LTDGPGIILSTSLPGDLDRHSPYWQLLARGEITVQISKQSQQRYKPTVTEVNKQQPFIQGYQYNDKLYSADNKVNDCR